MEMKHGSALVGKVLRTCLLMIALPIFAKSEVRAETSTLEKMKETHFLLALVGYNYTDHHISDYTVNGAGGAFVRLSSSTGGGSGITCCVRLSKKSLVPPRVKVRWQYDGCVYFMKNDQTGSTDWVRHFYYKEAEVELERADSGTPAYIETHFYPDGSVKVRSTDYFSDPLINLNPKRRDKSSFPKCKNNEQPEE